MMLGILRLKAGERHRRRSLRQSKRHPFRIHLEQGALRRLRRRGRLEPLRRPSRGNHAESATNYTKLHRGGSFLPSSGMDLPQGVSKLARLRRRREGGSLAVA